MLIAGIGYATVIVGKNVRRNTTEVEIAAKKDATAVEITTKNDTTESKTTT